MLVIKGKGEYFKVENQGISTVIDVWLRVLPLMVPKTALNLYRYIVTIDEVAKNIHTNKCPFLILACKFHFENSLMDFTYTSPLSRKLQLVVYNNLLILLAIFVFSKPKG